MHERLTSPAMLSEGPRKLLIVDDEPLVRQTLSLVLEDEYEVVAVGSGEEAISAALQETFPVVILDLCMEGLSGIETLRRLKKIREDQNVIILTAYESTETAIAALNLGAFNYLTKPFERRHLKEVVSRGFATYAQVAARREEFRQRLMGVHDEFFSLLCHEFNTPLNVILGFSELLSTSADNPEHATWAAHIRDSGAQLHGILMEIVDYIAAGHLASAGVERLFVFNRLIQPALDRCAERGIQVNVFAADCGETKLVGPSEATGIIVRKLLDLASRRSNHVRLSAQVTAIDGPHLEILVRGTGIRHQASGEMERLFEPYQFPTKPETASNGLGLELATCRRIAEYAHASIEGRLDPHGELELVARVPVQIIQ